MGSSGGSGGGDFVGPASALGGSLVLFDGTTGKLGKDAAVVLSAFAKTLLDDASAGAVRTTIGAGTGSGDFVGPGTATDTAIVVYDGTTGKLGKNSVVTISPTGDVAGVGDLVVADSIDAGGLATLGSLEVTGSLDVGAAATVDSLTLTGADGVQLPSGSPLKFSTDAGVSRAGAADIAFGNGTAGNATATLKFGGGRCRGLTTSAASASTTEYPTSGDWGLHKNTTTGITAIARNDGGVMKLAALA